MAVLNEIITRWKGEKPRLHTSHLPIPLVNDNNLCFHTSGFTRGYENEW